MSGEGISRVAGAPATIVIDDETFVLGRFELEDWGVAENYLLEQKQDRILALIARQREILPKDVWQQEWDKARARAEVITSIPYSEVSEWIDTDEGLAWMLWYELNKTNPGRFTLQKLQKVIATFRAASALLELERLKRARDKAAAIDEASKNSTGPTTAETVVGQGTAGQETTNREGAPNEAAANG